MHVVCGTMCSSWGVLLRKKGTRTSLQGAWSRSWHTTCDGALTAERWQRQSKWAGGRRSSSGWVWGQAGE